jgi:ADP-ribose pyrophosphatase
MEKSNNPASGIEIASTETIYKGRIFDLQIADIRHDELEYQREIVVHNGSVVIVPVFDDGTVAMVRQYRYAAGKFLLEIPAGTLNKDEPMETGARRELEEEIGVTAEKLEKITEFYVSPGFLTEKMYVYLATGLTATAQNLEDDEILSVEKYSFPELFRKIGAGEIEDAKTICGLFLAGAKLGFSF